MMPSNHLILPTIFTSIWVFSNELALLISWPKYWSFSFGISPSNEYSGLISFMIDWFDLLADQRTLKSHLLHHNLKASILWHSVFFMVQHPYMTAGKIIALTIWTSVNKMMPLLSSRIVIAFLARNKHLLISQLQSPFAVILEPKKTKSVTVSTFSQPICHEVIGPDAMILGFWILSFKPGFHSLLLPSSRGSLVSLHFLPLQWYHLHI